MCRAKWKRQAANTKSDYASAFEAKLSKGTIQNDLLLMVKLGLTEKADWNMYSIDLQLHDKNRIISRIVRLSDNLYPET